MPTVPLPVRLALWRTLAGAAFASLPEYAHALYGGGPGPSERATDRRLRATDRRLRAAARVLRALPATVRRQ